MAEPRPSETPTFNNNPQIAAEIEREKVETRDSDNISDHSEDTRAEHNDDPSGAFKESTNGQKLDKPGTYDKIEITEEDCYDELGYGFPVWKKWTVLTVVFLVQVSMNFNTSLYSNAVTGISEEFGVSAQAARVGAAIFLITYAFGCELWAPWVSCSSFLVCGIAGRLVCCHRGASSKEFWHPKASYFISHQDPKRIRSGSVYCKDPC